MRSVNNLKRVREEETQQGVSNATKVQKLLVAHPKHTGETAAKIAVSTKIRSAKATGREMQRTATEEEKFITFRNRESCRV